MALTKDQINWNDRDFTPKKYAGGSLSPNSCKDCICHDVCKLHNEIKTMVTKIYDIYYIDCISGPNILVNKPTDDEKSKIDEFQDSIKQIERIIVRNCQHYKRNK